jgi:hypothetical protein
MVEGYCNFVISIYLIIDYCILDISQKRQIHPLAEGSLSIHSLREVLPVSTYSILL